MTQPTTTITLELTDLQIAQLREVMDELALRPYAPLIVSVLKALPFRAISFPERFVKFPQRLPHAGSL